MHLRQGWFAPVAISALVSACTAPMGGETLDESLAFGSDELPATQAALRPSSDVVESNVVGVGDTVDLWRDVDDGTSFAASDNGATMVKGAAGTSVGRHRVGYSGAPSGTVTGVTVSYRAAAASSTGTARVRLYDGATLVGTGRENSLGSTFASFSDTFTGLAVASGNQLRTEVELRKSSGSGALRYTMVWISVTVQSVPSGPYRAFTDASYWNTPLPADAPLEPTSSQIIARLNQATYPYLRLAGIGADAAWADPIYWAQDGDPVYNVTRPSGCPFNATLPPEFASIRIPATARANDSGDPVLQIYDLGRGYVAKLSEAVKQSGRWYACGGSLYYVGSNGLDGNAAGADEPRNRGHRGIPPPVEAFRFDEVQAGAVRHVLRVTSSVCTSGHVWPMTGDEGTVTGCPIPEGTRLRIRRSVNLDALPLSPAARVLAQALQTYGGIVCDRGGGPNTMKSEDTLSRTGAQMWTGVLRVDSLSALPFDSFEVIRHGYRPPAP